MAAAMLLLAGAAPLHAGTALIPFSEKTLDNGLRVIVHEDRKAPVVAVNIWYHVGSKNESPGRTGFAHLFEHLMFQGSENNDRDYISALEKLGATDLNGTTWFDRTNYFQTVPRNALDTVLWLESDRMGHFAASITQDKLDEQRGVVQNEKRQGDNQPYGKVFEKVLRQVFPPNHPYSWETIGSMDDLDAATLEDVRKWFATWYGPNNAVLVIAGDIDTGTAFERAAFYFGDIPPGPPLSRPDRWVPAHETERRAKMQDRVPQPRLYLSWAGPQWGSRDAHHLMLAAKILGGDKNSRLYRRLVYRGRLATDVALVPLTMELSGITYLEVSAAPGHTLAELEAAIEDEISRFADDGPTRSELERVKVGHRADFLRGIEKVGGFQGKSNVLASNAVYGGSPARYMDKLDDIAGATREDLRRAASRWLGRNEFALEVRPFPDLAAADAGADRLAIPEPVEFPDIDFPPFERLTLDNGLDVIVATRAGVPLVDLSLILDAGYASDQFSRAGTAKVSMSMLDEGTGRMNALEISEALALEGATLNTGSNLDTSYVSLSALKERLDPALEIFADVVMKPAFPDEELERLREIVLTEISQEKSQPTSMALRVLPKILYGTGHPYGQPLTGSGSEQSIRATTREDLVRFHDSWFRPNHSTLIIVGDAAATEIKPRLEKLFGSWQPGDIPEKNVARVTPPTGRILHIVDRPGSEQSVIFAGQLLPPKANPDEVALQAANDILGGNFSARINMNLREDKHWSYGARTFIRDARGQRPLMAFAQVQSDKTAESIAELQKEFAGIGGDRPPTEQELTVIKRADTLSLAGRWESARSVLASISQIVQFGLPDDYWSGYADRVNALDVEQVSAVAGRYVTPDDLAWVVVGDRAVFEDKVHSLGFDEIRFVDADGNPVEP